MDSIDKIDWKQIGVFDKEGVAMELLVIYCMATIGFTAFYYVNKMFFPSLMHACAGPEGYFFGLDDKNKREYFSRNVADLHALIAAPLSYYVCFHICDDPNQSIFSSQECLMKPQRSQLALIAISTGYVTYDVFICIFELGYTLSKGGDFIAHHIVGIIGALCVVVAGRFNVALSAGNLFSEWTSFPMNYRWRMLKHKQTEGVFFIVVNAIFFGGYVIARVFFMAWLLFRNFQIQQVFAISSDPPIVYYCAIMSTVLQVCLYLIQMFWFKLIFGAFMRTIKGGKPQIASKDA